MYGLIVKLTVAPGTGEKMAAILKHSAADMLGCFSYVVAEDAADENVLCVTEVWDSQGSHAASLSLPDVKNAIPQVKEIVASFERVAVTRPLQGSGAHSEKGATNTRPVALPNENVFQSSFSS
jgi:quinol monooxygenase YgiN